MFSHGDFALILDVPEGEHQYKFQVDGQWKHSSTQVKLWFSVVHILLNILFNKMVNLNYEKFNFFHYNFF